MANRPRANATTTGIATDTIASRSRSNATLLAPSDTRSRSHAVAEPAVETRTRSKAITHANVITRGRSDATTEAPMLNRQRADAMDMSRGRANAISEAPRTPAFNNLSSQQLQRLDSAIGQGPGKMHQKSEKRLHKEREFVYDQSKRGAIMQTLAKHLDFSVSKDVRHGGTEEARELKAYQSRIKEKNPEAAKREKTAGNYKKVKTGAKYVNYGSSVASFFTPQIAAPVKIAAKTTGILAGAKSAYEYHKSTHAYTENINEKATGMAMLDSHIAREKAAQTKTMRNKMTVSTATSLVGLGASFGLDAIAEHSSKAAEVISNTRADLALDGSKKVAKKGIDLAFQARLRENKSELTNLMRHQRVLASKK